MSKDAETNLNTQPKQPASHLYKFELLAQPRKLASRAQPAAERAAERVSSSGEVGACPRGPLPAATRARTRAPGAHPCSPRSPPTPPYRRPPALPRGLPPRRPRALSPARTGAPGQPRASPRSGPDPRRPAGLAAPHLRVATSGRSGPAAAAATPSAPGRTPTHRLLERPTPEPGPWAAPAAPAASLGAADPGCCPPRAARRPPGSWAQPAVRWPLALDQRGRGAPSRPHGDAKDGQGAGRGCGSPCRAVPFPLPPETSHTRGVPAHQDSPPWLASHPCEWGPLQTSDANPPARPQHGCGWTLHLNCPPRLPHLENPWHPKISFPQG
ncbi:basic proline-rich protein-like [Hippopotamus amphibius kiboko]|uniref:basic proline-rich protein-like n=1 Tax=Hippopotamus amphibius kiboko TaxID=575201 RepID=UPI002593E9ED|nr:basic proline-rich protein-like [Hippopotamus amphibius kiboko]